MLALDRLNDAFIPDEVLAKESKIKQPNPVNRQAILEAWEKVWKANGRVLPLTDYDRLRSISEAYINKSTAFRISDYKKAAAYSYFGALLDLIVVTHRLNTITSNHEIYPSYRAVENDLRVSLRSIERQLTQEELTPKV